jgi:hypothetical protein
MPRLGVPSTTDSARVIADVCGEPAPLPRSTNPRHNDRPGGTFPRVVQPLIETWEKGRKEGAWGPPQGQKPRVQAAAQWRRFHVPRPTSKRASSASIPTPTPTAAPWKPLISRSFQAERQKAADGHFGALSIKVTAEDKPRKEHDLGITLGRGETHGICDALGRKIPLRRDFHGDCPDHQRRAPAAAPASRSKPSAMARK